jgi:superoxide dismutase, Fe-Mn family
MPHSYPIVILLNLPSRGDHDMTGSSEFENLPAMTAEEVRAMSDAGKPVRLLDVRPKHYVTASGEIIEGAEWRDHERLQEWIAGVPKDQPVVTICAFGSRVGPQVAAALREAGVDARYMSGGHAAWKAMNGPVQPFVSGDNASATPDSSR